MMQPIFDPGHWNTFRKRIGGKSPVPVIVGMWPLTSFKQALRLNNEVSGIVTPEPTLCEMEKAGDAARERAAKEATMKGYSIRFLLALVALASLTYAIVPRASAADKHPFSVDDYSALRFASAVSISPDGKVILYRVSFDGASGPVGKHKWYLIDIRGENPRKLDLPENCEPSGFTKEGSLYGIYPVSKFAQLATVPLEEGKLIQILSLPSGIRSATIERAAQ